MQRRLVQEYARVPETGTIVQAPMHQLETASETVGLASPELLLLADVSKCIAPHVNNSNEVAQMFVQPASQPASPPAGQPATIISFEPRRRSSLLSRRMEWVTMKPAVQQDASIDLKFLADSISFDEMSKHKAAVEEEAAQAQICCHRYSSCRMIRILCCVVDGIWCLVLGHVFAQ